MKNIISKVLFSCLLLLSITLLSEVRANAQTYKKQLVWCGQYTNYPDCQVWVIMCKIEGGLPCDVSEQFPCEEVCPDNSQD